MNGSYLLDTSVVIAFLGNDQRIIEYFVQAKQLFLPSIVLGELYYGALRSRKPEENSQQILEFGSKNVILAIDDITAQHYAIIKNQLRIKGRPIPENDLWIAAIAMQYQLVIATRDKHFHEIEGLIVEEW
ncbi:PilT protein domain protein [Oscillochloris trichoides DG-6]|uniref:Ribonuclease VapC n=1 Tax=Oscillochloris trichoides DG-6 TaxID=765420 RepID=E1IDI3_9CHLR|nr:type II toxin-antitoxin system VapC family toxin [Oscillochloris trichoides]EFO80763.1 PilT protein domain protein [Oscillochloris trichoides DG-6]